MFIRGPFNYDRDLASLESGLECVGESLTVQSQKEESDINVIVKRFGITGQLPENVRVPTYQDFEDVFDFQSAMNAMVDAERSFNAMPADVRARFLNDPHKFVEFCTAVDEDGVLVNLDEMRKLGLAVPKADVVESPPQRVVVVSENSDGSGDQSDGARSGADVSKATSGESGKGSK